MTEIKYKKGQVWNKPKNKLMLKFEKDTNKSALRGGKITGQFEYWLWQQNKKLSSTKNPTKKPKPETTIKKKSKVIIRQKDREYTRKQIKRKLRNALKVFRTPENSIILDDMIEETLDKIGFRIIAEATISELRDSFRVNSLKHLQDMSKINKINNIIKKVKKYPKEYPYRQQGKLHNDIKYVKNQIKNTSNTQEKLELIILKDKLIIILKDF